MAHVIDVYEEARIKARQEFDEFCKVPAVSNSLRETLSNKSRPTDYVAWSNGCRQFDEDHHEIYEAMFGT